MRDLTRTRAQRLLRSHDVAHIGVIADGEAYVTPISYVYRDDEVLFRTGPGRRLDAIRRHPRVCIEVSTFDHATGDWESVVVYGRARVVSDEETEAWTARALRTKYRRITKSAIDFGMSPAHNGVVVAVEVSEMSGRGSGVGLQPKDRPGRL